jgi:short-subunit dehydrogenase
MSAQHKPIDQQVMLITGASSGIGRQTALRAAQAGASVILVARNREALQSAVAEIEAAGGEASYFVADVADMAQLQEAAKSGQQRFGRIDTWVNNAGVGMYSRILSTDVADDRRLFETNFWGVVNGSRLAVSYLQAAGGGALINLGSEVSDVSIPIQGMYSTSKHAVMGFTDALREEIIEARLPITVTLIKPAAINTPFPRHAKNNLDRDATLPAPVYAVDLVADQILHAAVHGNRELYVGGGGRLMALLGQHFPSMTDWLMARFMVGQQLADRPADHSNEGLYETRGFHRAEGDVDRDRHVQKMSLYGIASRNPIATTLVVAAGVAAAGYLAKAEYEKHA